MTIQDAQKLLNISKQRVYVLLRKKQITLTEESIRQYMENKKNGRPKTKQSVIERTIEKYDALAMTQEERKLWMKIKEELCQKK